MHLIDVNTLQLVEFAEDKVPYGHYAIISHRWTDAEVTFKQFRKGLMNKDSIGYDKIVKSCNFAKSRSRSYIWIDTVCIDKRSSAELSEAINSMYRWYKRSAECYVHLSDVDAEESPLEAFRNSTWFTRGWTLQELLAPAQVIFLTRDWQTIGLRQDDEIATIISNVTGIGVYDLNNFTPHRPCVARKMSWAAKRRTTRPEDSAYCLLGLFDVNMPLLYGEGGLKAFMRLQLEIIKKSDDKSIFAWGWESEQGLSWYGLLAPSPDPFEHCGNIIVSDRDLDNKYPYEITNQGLSLQSRAELILGDRSEKYVVSLDCTKAGIVGQQNRQFRCYLILETTSSDGRFFRRRHIAFGGLGEDLARRYPSGRREDVGVKHFYIKQAGL